jgi:hypothetical protein
VFNLPRRKVLQAAIAAGGFHALSGPAAAGVDALLGGDVIFGDGFEPTPPAPTPVAGASSGTASAYLSSTLGAIDAPVSFGMALREGAFPATPGIATAGLDAAQVEVLNRWPDGSAKFAVVSGRCTVPAGGTIGVTLRRGTPAGGPALTEANLLASGVDATLQFAGGPVMTLSSLVGVAAAGGSAGLATNGRVRQLASGPQMSAWLYAARLSSTSAHVLGFMEVRYYGGNRVHVLPWVENGLTRVAGSAGQVGTLVFTLGGTSRFSQSDVFVGAHCRVVAQNAQGVGHWAATAPDVYAAPDPVYLQGTGLVPPYHQRDTRGAGARLDALASTYSPAAYGQLTSSPRDSGGNATDNGDFDAGMAAAGYHAGIGPLPEWDAFYLTSRADVRAWRAVVANALGYGRYGVHFRDELTLAPVSPADVPNKTLSQASVVLYGAGGATRGVHAIADVGANQFGSAEVLPAPAGHDMGGGQFLLPEYWAQTHHPSAGYLAYLLTGHEYFLELNQMVAGTCFLRQNNVHRNYSSGWQLTHLETTRGAAWGLRSIFQAATLSRDGSALQSGFAVIAANNIARHLALYISSPCGSFGVPRPYANFQAGATPPRYTVNAWELDFSISAWGFGLGMKPPVGAAALADVRAYFHWHAQFVVGRLGPLGDATTYGYNAAGRQNSVAIANTSDDSPWINNQGPWMAHWGEAFQLTHNASNATNNTPTLGAFDANNGFFPDATSYWGNLHMALAYAVEHEVPGAWEGYLRMINAGNWPAFDVSAASFPVGSLRSSLSPPKWAALTVADQFVDLGAAQSFLAWANAGGVTPGAYRGTGPFASMIDAYSDPACDPATGHQYLYGGGHGDGTCDAVVKFDADTLTFSQVGNPTPPSVYHPQYLIAPASTVLTYPSGVYYYGGAITQTPRNPPAGFGWFLTAAESPNPSADAALLAPQLSRMTTHVYGAAALRGDTIHHFYLNYGEFNVRTGRWSGRDVDLGGQLAALSGSFGSLTNEPQAPGTYALYDEVTDRFIVTCQSQDRAAGNRRGVFVFDPVNRVIESYHRPDGLGGVPIIGSTPTVQVGRELWIFTRPDFYNVTVSWNQGYQFNIDTRTWKRFIIQGDPMATYMNPSNTVAECLPCYFDGSRIVRWNYHVDANQVHLITPTPVGGDGSAANPLVYAQTTRAISGAPAFTKLVYKRIAWNRRARCAVLIPNADARPVALRLA